jgi:hypothetical protein
MTIVSILPVEVSVLTIVQKSIELDVNQVHVEKVNAQLEAITDHVRNCNLLSKSSLKLDELYVHQGRVIVVLKITSSHISRSSHHVLQV